MSRDVKVYRVAGLALFSPDKLRRWQKFTIEVRAVRKEEAVERVLSELGSRHKLKRSHIKIVSVEEAEVSEARSKLVREIENLERWYIER
jgi:large subunit ribosomal protein LX